MKRTGKKTARLRTLLGLVWGLVACAVISMLFGCSTLRTIEVPVEVERVQHDTTRSVAWRSDTLIIKDTVRMAGDTVYHSVWSRSVSLLHDTLWRTRTDTIQIPIQVKETVTEYRTPWYAKVIIGVALAVIIVLVALLVVGNIKERIMES